VSQNLTPQTIYDFITKDFEAAWNSLACNPSKSISRGNFMFGKQTMVLLEFLSRLCKTDATGQALQDLSRELSKIDNRYFTQLPGDAPKPKCFDLPNCTQQPQKELLWHIFDLVRNGQAHQYQQIKVELSDKKSFIVTLKGARYGLFLKNSRNPRPHQHLGFQKDPNGDIALFLYPNVMFLDIEDAVANCKLLSRHLSFGYLKRQYKFDSTSLETALKNAGHSCI
jgi:hypothetical protein